MPDALAIKASQAARAWGVKTRPRLLSHRENAVYAVELPEGRPAALRLHRPGYSSGAEIRSELWWTQALAERGIPVPEPVFCLSGAPCFELASDEFATVVSWVDGKPIGAANVALTGSASEKARLYSEVGALLARFHSACDALVLPPDFTRRAWNADGFFGDKPHWGRFWENPALKGADKGLVLEARAKAKAGLGLLERKADAGLIHADALRENVFQTARGLYLIDFDDAGFGFRLYDLAVALSQSIDDDDYDALMHALIEGYARHRPIDTHAHDLIPLFRLLRVFAQLGWIVSRAGAHSEAGLKYLQRARRFCRAYLDAN